MPQHCQSQWLRRFTTLSFKALLGIPCSASLAPTLTMIINESLAIGTVPDILKLANVCPLHKNGDPYDSRNYRPISFLPIISKLLEKVVHRQLVKHLQHPSNAHGLPHEQFEYRHHHLCEDALTLAVNNWQLWMKGQFAGLFLRI